VIVAFVQDLCRAAMPPGSGFIVLQAQFGAKSLHFQCADLDKVSTGGRGEAALERLPRLARIADECGYSGTASRDSLQVEWCH
jgi:hypothetical protein